MKQIENISHIKMDYLNLEYLKWTIYSLIHNIHYLDTD